MYPSSITNYDDMPIPTVLKKSIVNDFDELPVGGANDAYKPVEIEDAPLPTQSGIKKSLAGSMVESVIQKDEKYDFEKMIEEAMKKYGEQPAVKAPPDK